MRQRHPEFHRLEATASPVSLLAPGGKLWGGELHETDCGRFEFTSKRAALRHVRERYASRFAIAFARHLWRHRKRASKIVAPAPVDW